MNIDYIFISIAIIVGILLPAYAMLTASKTIKYIQDNPQIKIGLYKQTSLIQFIIVLIIVALFLFFNLSIELLGLSFNRPALPAFLIFSIPLIFIWVLLQFDLKLFSNRFIENKYGEVLFLLPNTRSEFNWSIVMSFSVGFSEEVLYRGFLFWQVNQILPPFEAALLVNIAFAMNHAATKFKNAIGAFAFGIIMSATYFLTGSLWLAIIIHIMIDVFAMILSYRYHNNKIPITRSTN